MDVEKARELLKKAFRLLQTKAFMKCTSVEVCESFIDQALSLLDDSPCNRCNPKVGCNGCKYQPIAEQPVCETGDVISIIQSVNEGHTISLGEAKQKLSDYEQPVCETCGGSGEVPKKDYIGCCGYNDCQGKWYKKDIREKHEVSPEYPRGGYTFICWTCKEGQGRLHFREKLIDWPKIPCPACQQPPAGEFTEDFRATLNEFVEIDEVKGIVINKGFEACDRIDCLVAAQEVIATSQKEVEYHLEKVLAENKDYQEAMRLYKPCNAAYERENNKLKSQLAKQGKAIKYLWMIVSDFCSNGLRETVKRWLKRHLGDKDFEECTK